MTLRDDQALARQDMLMRSIELGFRNDVIKEKNRYIERIADVYKLYGDIKDEDFQTHKSNMYEIFKKNYSRIIRVFSLEIERIALKDSPYVLEKKQDAWEFYLSLWLSEHGANKVNQTSRTTQLDVTTAIAQARDADANETDFIRSILTTKRFSPWRADAIARTETHQAAMFASKKTAEKITADTGLVLKKKWVPTTDDRTRISHIGMAGSSAIGMDEKFTVGGERLDRPGDPAGSAGNVINCRCVMVYERS